MAYVGAAPANRVLSSADIAQGSVTLDDINFTDQPANMDISGTINKHTMRLADGVTVTGDMNITDDLVLSKLSDDGNAITLTDDGTSRTIEGAGGTILASTISSTPNASLTGMTGTVGSGVTFPSGHVLQVVQGENRVASTGTYVAHTATASSRTTVVSAAITPSNVASKILINFMVNLSGDGGSTALHILRDSTEIGQADAAGSRVRSIISNGNWSGGDDGDDSYDVANYNGVFLDSPSSTSAITYSVRLSMYTTGTYRINRTDAHRDNAAGYDGVSASYIVLQEIA